MWRKFINILTKIFYQFTGHHHDCLLSISNFMELMHKPVDGASLGIARMLFGIMMLIDIPEERGGSDIDFRFGEPKNCSFPLFSFIKPLTLPFMGVVYAIMWFGAIGITLGYKFRLSCLMFVIPYWYLFLLDKSVWNNHSYLFGLCGLIFLFSQSHRYCSIDALLLRSSSSHSESNSVPFWNYFIIKYQFFILYTIAGLKKLSSEWLSGYALLNLSYHWVFSPFRFIIGKELTDLLIVHWFGCVFDLTIVFWLIYRRTRLIATVFALSFHFMNSRLFAIGMFPWLCVVQLPLFYRRNWPRALSMYICDKFKILNNRNENVNENIIENTQELQNEAEEEEEEEFNNQPKPRKEKTQKKITIRKQITIYLMLFYCALQLFLPYSHFITKGYNNWTDGIYGYSWDMMIHAWDTVQITIRIVDNGNGKSHFIEPNTFTENDRWSKHADMAKQHAICINDYLVTEYNLHRNVERSNNNYLLTSDNYSIYFDVWCSLNGRFQQRMFNPTIDILRAEWSPFRETTWIMPLLKQFTDMRTNISKISNDLLSQNNYTDILFIADFPTFILDNFIADELENVTLTVLTGTVRYESDTGQIIDRIQKQSINIESGVIHKIETISKTPSCYMYTYINKTVRLSELKDENTDPLLIIVDDVDDDDENQTSLNVHKKLLNNENNNNDEIKFKSKLPIWSELKSRYENYKRFLANIANSFLFIIYKVPMPVRLK